MNSITIKVPNNGDPNLWFKFINESISKLDLNFQKLIVDFNTVPFLDTDDFVVLACLLELFYNKKIKIEFLNGKKIKNHLSGIKFKKYWTDGFNRDKFTLTHNKNTLCLWHICPEMLTDYSTYAKKYYERLFLKDKDSVPLTKNLSEIFNNIFHHSKSEVNGYIITQYFHNTNKLSFSVCDFGIGIANCLNNYYTREGKDNVTDSNAIKKSLDYGESSYSTIQNKGFGLSDVLDFTQSFKGTLSIYSNNGFLLKKFDEDFILIETGHNFYGTLIKVEVNTLEFDKIDEESIIFDL
jgi:anti-sigma regulatory factor (Ser/Thr protein kinase)